MSTARANLETVISADMSQYSATMRKAGMVAQATAGKIGKSMANAAANLAKAGVAAAGLATVIGGAALVRGIKNAADLGGKLADLSARTSIAAGDLAVLGRAFEDNGVSADKIGATINKLQKAIVDFGAGSETAAKPFNALGISFSEISALSPAKQFALIQQKIAGIADPAQRAAVAIQLFGKSGGEMLTLFADSGALGKAGEFLGTQAEILNRRAATFDEISDILARAGAKLQGFTVGVLDAIADKLLPALQYFDQLDLAQEGQEFGQHIKAAADDTFRLAQILKKTADFTGGVFGALADPNYWTQLGKLITASLLQPFTKFHEALNTALKGGSIQEIIDSALAPMSEGKLPSTKKISDLAKGALEGLRPYDEFFDEIFNPTKGVDDWLNSLPKAAEKAAESAEKFSSAMSSSESATGRLVDKIKGLDFFKPKGLDFSGKGASSSGAYGHFSNGAEMGPPKWLMGARAAQSAAEGYTRPVLGRDNIFARDRARLGIVSGLHTGGLRESRSIRIPPSDPNAKKQLTEQQQANRYLHNIETKIGSSLSAS